MVENHCHKLNQKRLDPPSSRILVMDDEIYCPANQKDFSELMFYSGTSKKSVLTNYKFSQTENIVNNT